MTYLQQGFKPFKATNLLTYQPTHLPTYQHTNILTYQPTNLPTYQPTNLPIYQPTNLPTYRPTNLPTYQHTDLPTYQPTNLPTYQPTTLLYTQKNLLCIHNRSLVHAQHSCACSGPETPGARDPKKARSRARDRPSAFFGSLAPGVPGPEHAQECCACTRDLLCIHKRFFCVYTINVSM